MSRPLSRRRFLSAAAGLGLAAALPAEGDAPLGPPVYFVPAADYHPLPPECYADNVIRPSEIILHWDGNRHGRELWKVAITYETLAYVGLSSHFAVDAQRVWQLLPMYRTQVQQSYGALGYNKVAINIEMAGRDFDQPEFAPAENQVRLTLELVNHLLDFYALPPLAVFGHFEHDATGRKPDPGPKFLASFRERLAAHRAGRSPVRNTVLEQP